MFLDTLKCVFSPLLVRVAKINPDVSVTTRKGQRMQKSVDAKSLCGQSRIIQAGARWQYAL